eukprot:TRINITY_DN29485_c0_g1_i1.p1 TRINITY_DN29485_c0_g1~~TRINITY_DN29485_c0_g1_i1.p1  ORF type:complete len:321 (-),score=68.59 TRINITY_DN29485_c0_g1_i1:320-1159(-)
MSATTTAAKDARRRRMGQTVRAYAPLPALAEEELDATSGKGKQAAKEAKDAKAELRERDAASTASTRCTIAESCQVSVADGEFSSSGRTACSSLEEERVTRSKITSWESLPYGQYLRPYKHHAHCTDDVWLASRLLEMIAISEVDAELIKLLLKCLKFLRLCDYSAEDICSILAHTSAYFADAYQIFGAKMSGAEVGNVLATQMFIAHCYVQDEACPLSVWHQHLFRKYCTLKMLDAAVLRLMEVRGYKLRLEQQELQHRYDAFLQTLRARPPCCETVA